MANIAIYSYKSGCRYCDDAKKLSELFNENPDYKTAIKIIERDSPERANLRKLYDATTMPVILIDDVYIGGYSAFEHYAIQKGIL